MRMTVAIAALFLSGAVPAQAADLSTLHCVADTISASVREDIAVSARGLAAGDNTSPPQDSKQALSDAANRCGERFGWSETARTAARTYTLVDIGRAAVEKVADDAGIKRDPLIAAIHSLTPAQRTQVLQRENDGILALIAAARARGVPLDSYEQQRLVGVFAALVLYEEGQQAAFTAG